MRAKEFHGMSKHRAYYVWNGMITRCTNPSHKTWAYYGGRGIEVCPQWLVSFSCFWDDMGATYRPGLQLDRVDNDGNYTPENCVWVTRFQQGRNRRDNKRIATPWGTLTVAEAAERSGLRPTTLASRLKITTDVALVFSPPDLGSTLISRKG